MQVFHYTEVPAEPEADREGVAVRWAIGRNVGAPHFCTRIIEVAPGASTPHHAHAWEHEVVVYEGRGVVRSADGERALEPGTCVYVAPNEEHQFSNRSEDMLRLVCVIPHIDAG